MNDSAKADVKSSLQRLSEGLDLSSRSSASNRVSGNKRASSTENLRIKVARILSNQHATEDSVERLWTDEFSPRTVTDLVGNSSAINVLRSWLLQWSARKFNVQLKGQDRKCILISGPPGVGKTTTAVLLCKELGLQTLNINASDSRGKSGKVVDGIAGTLASAVREFVTNKCIGSDSEQTVRSALIMDEVDGMAGGDRGGLSELIDIIKQTRIPIICICNDRYSQKLKTLANYCVDLPFQRPNKLQIRKYVVQLANSKRLQIDQDSVDSLIEANNNDLRSIINQLQLWSMGAILESKETSRVKKDVSLGVFQAIDVMFRPSVHGTLDARLSLSFTHGDLLSLFVHENYPCMRPKDSVSDLQRLVHMAAAASRVSEGDVFASTISRTQNWSILPSANVIASVLPSSAVSGAREISAQGERNTHRFPSCLGRISSKSKSQRLLHKTHMHVCASGILRTSAREFCLRYMNLVRRLLTLPLFSEARGGKELAGVENVLDFMHTYHFTREDWDDIQIFTRLSGKGPLFESPGAQIHTSVKAAFTRACKHSLSLSTKAT
ncbi:P-loop containing nucleoside triphosphate hydrolase [Ostreococcus tauri]|uniref:P-loop containing nucleoside triphosphate hydrolase n=1 Tax=Ostreococcus tauri TaxID=70448 RepID=Q01F52_OSTTA|nr:P-loop containing nucleoside triphosphate hydrolase [Ostreococcus tauri]CAL52049.1 P-loop containing nucleoside triphosphate hydrolase [Ostreococcus tauri]|eukprot:XP_003074791.1 P-loop containing nucleoside triphosphate hydrolase [Ostreococcus tauri]